MYYESAGASEKHRRRLNHESAGASEGSLAAPGTAGALTKDTDTKSEDRGWNFKTTNRKGCQFGFGPHNKTSYL